MKIIDGKLYRLAEIKGYGECYVPAPADWFLPGYVVRVKGTEEPLYLVKRVGYGDDDLRPIPLTSGHAWTAAGLNEVEYEVVGKFDEVFSRRGGK